MKNILSKKLGMREKAVLELIGQHKKRLFLAMLCMIVMAGATSVSAYLVKPMLDDVFINQDRRMLLLIPQLAVIVFLLKGIASYGQEYLMNYVGESIIRELRDRLYNKIVDLPMGFFHKERTGTLMSRITYDVNIVKAMVSTAVTNIARDIFTVLGLACVIVYMDWKLAIGAFVILPAAFYPIFYIGKRVRKFSKGAQERMADVTSFLYETLSGSKIVKIFNMEEYEKERFRKKNHDFFTVEMKTVRSRALSSPVMEFLGGLGIAFIVWFGGSRVISGHSTPGTFFSFLTAVMMLYAPVKKLSKLYSTVQQGVAAITRVFDVLQERSDIREPENPVILSGDAFGVSFRDVAFMYSPDEGSVLRDINLEVAPGEVLAIVGMSGGGKTSLVNLLPRFYDTTAGQITIGGHDIRTLSVKSLRAHISIVTQEPILFNETVRDNIRYGRMDASDESVEAAAKSAYAYDFVKGFPRGFDTVIGELGSRLSGGEKQRICIARALIKDAPILILDEATSALDAEAERIVQKALVNLMKNRTTFVIAHRLSTVDHADRIVFLKGGRIAEEGTHDQLMEKRGEYYKMQKMQHSNAREGGDANAIMDKGENDGSFRGIA